MNSLFIFSFHHCPEVVSQMHFTKKQQEEIYRNKNIPFDFMLLSTCYRSDIIVWSHQTPKEVLSTIREYVPGLSEHFSKGKLFCGKDAAKYFVKVSLGLESALIGETEITKQIADAIIFAEKEHRVGMDFHKVLIKIRTFSKKIRNRFDLSRGSFSHAYLAFKSAREHCPQENVTILLCGFGDLNQKIGKYFHKKNSAKMVFFTRHKQKEAKDFFNQEEMKNAKAKGYDVFRDHIQNADIVFFATDKRRPILRNEYAPILDARRKKLFVFDLSVPSDCETDMRNHPNIEYRSICDIDREIKNAQMEKEQKKAQILDFLAETNLLDVFY